MAPHAQTSRSAPIFSALVEPVHRASRRHRELSKIIALPDRVTTGVRRPAFPWGSNNPTRPQRACVAALATLLALLLLQTQYAHGFQTDFGQIWFGARSMLGGSDPYKLIGPGLAHEAEYPLLYPATALAAAIPISIFSLHAATFVFVGISTFLLAYSCTADSWHRLPIFASAAFVDSARSAQWSLIFTAAYFVPALAFLSAAKPQAAIPVIISGRTRSTAIAAFTGGAAMLLLSLYFLPAWPATWLNLVRRSEHFIVPITRLGGFLILLVLVRWKRRETWLLLACACLPQTLMWYSVLILLVIPETFREACLLSLISSIGLILADTTASAESLFWQSTTGEIFVLTTFLPTVVLILTRPNEGPKPAWLSFATKMVR